MPHDEYPYDKKANNKKMAAIQHNKPNIQPLLGSVKKRTKLNTLCAIERKKFSSILLFEEEEEDRVLVVFLRLIVGVLKK